MSPSAAMAAAATTRIRPFELKWRPDLRQGWVAGLDIGTSRTCVSFARCPLPEDPPECLAINTKPLIDAGARDLELKTKTAVLLGPGPEHPLIAFGYEAEDRYVSALEEEEEEGEQQEENQHQRPRNLLFTEWKMALAPPTAGTRRRCSPESVMYPSQCGTAEVPLLLLFQRTMEHAAKTVLEELEMRAAGEDVQAHDLLWCVTVPAGWDDYAKAFMRRAAFHAGLIPEEASDNLRLVYEPEAAFLGTIMEERCLLGLTGLKMMMVDVGGGTADVTVHELKSRIPLQLPQVAEREMDATLGSTAIDRLFEAFLLRFLGLEGERARAVRASWPWLELSRQFEEQKKSFNDSNKSVFRFQLGPLIDLLDRSQPGFSLEERVAAHGADDLRKANRTTLVLRRCLVNSFYAPVVRDLVSFVAQAHSKVGPDCPRIITAGGFGESKVLIAALRRSLSGVEVVTSARPSVSIARGAIIYGLTQSIPIRILPRTYGIVVSRVYEPLNPMHVSCGDKVELIDGVQYVRIFQKLAGRGERVRIPTYSPVMGPYWPITDHQSKASFRFVVSDDESPPDSADDVHQTLAGSVTVPLDMSRPTKDDRAFFVQLQFDETEICALITDRQQGSLMHNLQLAYE